MNREERVRAAIEGREPDRIPASVWMHISDKDQDPRSLAEAMVEFNETYDYDFIKMMPFGAYTVSDWGASWISTATNIRKWKLRLLVLNAGKTTRGSSHCRKFTEPGAK